MRIPPDVLLRHLWVVGMTGAGKSTALLSWIVEMLQTGIGVGLIDPNSDLFVDALNHMVRLPRKMWERAIVWEPLHPTHSIGFNPLEVLEGEDIVRRARFLATVITKIFTTDELITVRMQSVMFHSFWLLARMKLTLVEFPRLVTDRAWREGLLEKLPAEDYDLLRYWKFEFPSKNNERLATEWTQSSLARIIPFTSDHALKRIFGQQKSGFDFLWAMDERIPILVNLRTGTLGSTQARLFGAFVVAQFQLSAFRREAIKREARQQYILVIDEAPSVLTDDIEILLTQARKYGLSLIASHQHFEQLRDFPKLQSALRNSVNSMAVFRTGAGDAELFARDVFNMKLDMVKDTHVRKNPTGISLWPYETVVDNVWRPFAEIEKMYQKRLTSLNDFEFWFRQRGRGDARKIRVVRPRITNSKRHEQAVEELIARSVATYGRSHAEIDAEIAARHTGSAGKETPPNDEVFWE